MTNGKEPAAQGAGVNSKIGNVTYDDVVLRKIIGTVMSEVDGVLGYSGGLLSGIAGVFKSSDADLTKGIDVKIDGAQVAVTLKLVTEMGKSIPDIADEITRRTKEELQRVTGLAVSDLKISVVDTISKEEFEKRTGETGEPPKGEG